MDADKLSRARSKELEDLLHQVQLFARRAKTPENRTALSELEHELLEVEKRWQRGGLINGQEELRLAADRP